MTANYSIETAISISKELLVKGAAPDFVMIALVADGFSNQRAETILSWAQKQMEKDSEEIPNLVA